MMDMYYGERKQKVQEVVMEERQETPKEEEVKEEVIVETKVEPAPKSCCQKPKFLDNFLRRLNDVMDKID
jgi:Holliday junction resolvase RusA-like endonuclease